MELFWKGKFPDLYSSTFIPFSIKLKSNFVCPCIPNIGLSERVGFEQFVTCQMTQIMSNNIGCYISENLDFPEEQQEDLVLWLQSFFHAQLS